MKRLLLLIAAFVAIFSFSVAPVAAHGNDDDGNDDSSIQNKKKNWDEFKKRWDKDDYKKKAKDKANKVKQQSQERKSAFKKATCEERKAKLEALPGRLSERSQKIHNAFTAIYTKVQDYKTSKNLNVDNYDQLKAAVDSAQASAAESVLALGEISVTVDCSKPELATQLESLRTAAKETRQELKDYRTALVNLIKAVRTAAQAGEGEEAN